MSNEEEEAGNAFMNEFLEALEKSQDVEIVEKDEEVNNILDSYVPPEPENPAKNEIKYLLVCANRGMFLGTYGSDAYFTRVENSATHAPLFTTHLEALRFGYHNLNNGYEYAYAALPIEVKKKTMYVDVVSIIKAGWGEYVDDMFTNLNGYSEERPN
jgi:hypothetical protein